MEVSGLIKEGNYAECVPILEKVLKYDPRNGMAHRALGWCLLRMREQIPRAAAHHERALEIQPDDYVAHANMAEISFTLTSAASASINEERLRRGEMHIERARELNPRYGTTWQVLLKYMLSKGQACRSGVGSFRGGLRRAQERGAVS